MKNLPEQLLPLFIISRIHQLPLLERRENSILFPPPPSHHAIKTLFRCCFQIGLNKFRSLFYFLPCFASFVILRDFLLPMIRMTIMWYVIRCMWFLYTLTLGFNMHNYSLIIFKLPTINFYYFSCCGTKILYLYVYVLSL
jgi:hypothetical protein